MTSDVAEGDGEGVKGVGIAGQGLGRDGAEVEGDC